jgi:hypothetical protein
VTIAWTNGSGGRVNGTNWVRALDFVEIANRINRLRALEFLGPDNTLAAPFVADTGIAWTPGVYELRNAYPGIISGRDASPACNYMRWLTDSGSPISPSTSPPGGETSFFSLLNGGTNWTGSGPWIAAVDLNELRKGMELLTHGLWKFPVYLDGGLFSVLPDTPWFGGSVAYSTTYGELRTVGFVEFNLDGTPMTGLTNVTVRSSSRIWVTGSVACTVEVGRITMPLSVNGGVSRTWGRTWNSPWSTPGGDYASIGSVSLSPGTPASITGGAAASSLQAMIDGGPALQNILIRKTAPDNMSTVNVSASVDVEFDLIN